MDGRVGEWEQNRLIHELIQGREQAKLLQIQLNTPSSSSSHDQARGILVQNIISSYEKALSILNIRSSSSSTQDPQLTAGLIIESPPSLSGSPPSDQDSDRDVKYPQDLTDGSKKRKAFPRWTQKVRVSPGAGLEGPLDDGFSWRKYGQKDILGAKYPRGYYRCTHRNGQGCLATKQVQRTDEDPTVIEITYRGNHTCSQASKSTIPPSTQPHETQELSNIIDPQQHNYYQTQQQQPEQALWNLRQGLKIVTQDLDINPQQQLQFPPFHFPSPSPSMAMNSNFSRNFSPSFISTQASGSTNYNFQSSSHDSELKEIISGAAAAASSSATNSPTVGLDFPFGDVEYDPNFTFDNLGLSSLFEPFGKQTK